MLRENMTRQGTVCHVFEAVFNEFDLGKQVEMEWTGEVQSQAELELYLSGD